VGRMLGEEPVGAADGAARLPDGSARGRPRQRAKVMHE
jgi:hypothetical protein